MKFTEQDLEKAAKHIAFEAYHFHRYASLYLDLESPILRQAVRYALLLHFRVLLDFFFLLEPRLDDCAVSSFGTLQNFTRLFGDPTETIARADYDDLKRNLNKLLAHMTATRWTEARKPMGYYSRHFDAMNQLIDRFRQSLPHNVRRAFDDEWGQWERQNPPAVP